MDGDDILFKDSARNLGLVMDSGLRFKDHVNYKLRQGYSTIKLIYSHRQYLERGVRAMLCDSLVLSLFNFCDSVYGPCLDDRDKRRIQKIQNSCLRLIFGIRRRQRISHKLVDLKWLNMFNRRRLHTVCFFYKLLKYRTPPYLTNKVVYRTDVHNLNIRRKSLITIPAHRKETFKRSFSYNIASYINGFKITDFILSCAAVKKKIKTQLLSHQ